MHLRYQLSLLLAVVHQVYARPAQGQPKTPEAHVALCLRDGRNMADRYRREAAAFTKSNAAATDATSLAAELERFVNYYTRELETFKSRCITRPELQITRKTSPAILREDYPDIIGQHLVDYAPSTLQRFSMERLRSRAQFIKIGAEADRPAVVANVARKGDLATITFRKISWKVPDHKYGNCTRSRSPSRWRISGRYIQPEYDTSCEIIEKRWKTITYQAPTVTVPLSDADLAKPGEWVEVRINEENPNDASIVHAFAIHGRERGKQLIYYGMRLK